MMYFNRGYDGFDRFNGCFGAGYFGAWGMFIWIGILILLIGLVVWAIMKHKKDNDPVLLSLKEKFVRGEITEEEYLSKKRALNIK